MNSESAKHYTLGLDLGVSSIGWAAIETREDGTPIRILRTGSHIFEAGVDGGKLSAESAMTQGRAVQGGPETQRPVTPEIDLAPGPTKEEAARHAGPPWPAARG